MVTRCAVIIPLYKPDLSIQEQFSIQNTVSKLSKHDVYLVGPKHLSAFMEKQCAMFKDPIAFRTFSDQYFADIPGYNQLLISKLFYKQFEEYEYILIAQTDALVLKSDLDMWCDRGYSYIGAPWFEGYTNPVLPLRFMGVGNGGFSLRKVQDFLRVLNRPRFFKNKLMESWPGNWLSNVYRFFKDYYSFVFCNYQLNIDVNEDLFWGMFVSSRCSFFTVPTAEEAVSFAFEAHPDYLYELNHHALPFGCHALERYDSRFWLEVLEKNGFEITELT